MTTRIDRAVSKSLGGKVHPELKVRLESRCRDDGFSAKKTSAKMIDEYKSAGILWRHVPSKVVTIVSCNLDDSAFTGSKAEGPSRKAKRLDTGGSWTRQVRFAA